MISSTHRAQFVRMIWLLYLLVLLFSLARLGLSLIWSDWQISRYGGYIITPLNILFAIAYNFETIRLRRDRSATTVLLIIAALLPLCLAIWLLWILPVLFIQSYLDLLYTLCVGVFGGLFHIVTLPEKRGNNEEGSGGKPPEAPVSAQVESDSCLKK